MKSFQTVDKLFLESSNAKNSLFLILGIIYPMEFICSAFYTISEEDVL